MDHWHQLRAHLLLHCVLVLHHVIDILRSLWKKVSRDSAKHCARNVLLMPKVLQTPQIIFVRHNYANGTSPSTSRVTKQPTSRTCSSYMTLLVAVSIPSFLSVNDTITLAASSPCKTCQMRFDFNTAFTWADMKMKLFYCVRKRGKRGRWSVFVFISQKWQSGIKYTY